MTFFQKIYWFFSSYTDQSEKNCGRFFDTILNETSPAFVHTKLQSLMQKDLIRLNLYQEYRFKGYKNISKNNRKKLYQNAEKIRTLFHTFAEQISPQKIPGKIQSLRISQEKKIFLTALLSFLSPRKHYQYEKSAAFSKLLQDPEKNPLIGDCNQICTLYLALYATKFPIDDFKIHVLKDHVCLHYSGIDIEATNATITHYSDGKILPVTEMISTNILDISDQSESLKEITPKTFIKAAQCVFLISSERSIAQKNLFVAYHNLGIEALKNNQFESAYLYFTQSNDKALARSVWTQATKYFLKKKNFSKANKYARKSQEKKYIQTVLQHESMHLIEKKQYAKAERKLRSIHDEKTLLFLWKKQLYELNKTLESCTTIKDFRAKKQTLLKMKKLAHNTHNKKVIDFCTNILEKI